MTRQTVTIETDRSRSGLWYVQRRQWAARAIRENPVLAQVLTRTAAHWGIADNRNFQKMLRGEA